MGGILQSLLLLLSIVFFIVERATQLLDKLCSQRKRKAFKKEFRLFIDSVIVIRKDFRGLLHERGNTEMLIERLPAFADLRSAGPIGEGSLWSSPPASLCFTQS